MSRTAVEIIGREEELGSIQAFLDRAHDGSCALVLSGEAGIGKTILWEAGLEEAEQRLSCVLLHRGAEAEASLSFTALSDLLVSVFGEVASSLAPMRRSALEVALMLAEPGEKARAGAARCRGLVLAAEGDLTAGFAALETSVADAAPYPLERGRTLLCLGTVRRQAQQKRSAGEALEQALAIFEELGARLWAGKARAELERIGGRPRPSDELTPTERRVAELAAQDRSNKEIAAELYMGVSTVEAHLTRVYRKLGIRSRTGLAGRIAPPGHEAALAGGAADKAAEV